MQGAHLVHLQLLHLFQPRLSTVPHLHVDDITSSRVGISAKLFVSSTPSLSVISSSLIQVSVINSCSSIWLLTPCLEIDANCTNLWLGYNYCVAPYPPFSAVTPAPLPTTNYTSATIFSYPIPTANYTITYTSSHVTAAGVPVPTNIANGTRPVACGSYYDIQVNIPIILTYLVLFCEILMRTSIDRRYLRFCLHIGWCQCVPPCDMESRAQ